MAHIEPFAAIRYTTPEVSHLIAPPYDVLGESEKQLLLAKDDHNIVAVDLPHLPPTSAGPDSAYQQAAGELTSWLDIRCVARDSEPAIYVYHQTYKLGGRTLTRKMFFAALRLEPLGSGIIFPHEQTFGGPKEDRLKLTSATRCHMSSILGLYPDPSNEISSILDEVVPPEPHQFGMLEGVQNKLWAVTDDITIDAVREKMADKPIIIADGHHRYSTALMYRDREIAQVMEPPAGHPIHFALAALCGMEDPGAVIQPYFRSIGSIAGLTAAKLQQALGADFGWHSTSKPASAEELARKLATSGSGAMALYIAKERLCAIIAPREPDLLARYEPRKHPAWRRLAYSIFHRCVVDEVLTKSFGNGTPPPIHYHKHMQDAIAEAQSSGGIAALMPAVTLPELREVCLAGELMPQKSTYFHPKLATGLVIYPLY